MQKHKSLEDEPAYQKTSRLKTYRHLKPKEKLKATKKLEGKTRIKRVATHKSTRKPSKIKSVSKLKSDLDIVFGRFVKYRDGNLVSGQWEVPCITCAKPFVYRDTDGKRSTVVQAGHFMSRGLGATRYHEQNVNGQCAYCNKWLAGDQYNHGLKIDKKYGPGTAAMLYDLSRQPFKFKRDWLEDRIAHYTEAIASYEKLW